MRKIVLKECKEPCGEFYYKVVELHDNVIFNVGERLDNSEVKRLIQRPNFKVVIR